MRNILRTKNKSSTQPRRGAAAVEAAVCLPFLVMVIMGTIEMGMALRVKTVLQSAVRESGRLSNIDYRGILQPGDTPNAKIERDLRNYVTASGFPGDKLIIELVKDDSPTQTFDLLDETNELKFLRINVAMPYAEVGYMTSRWIPTPNISARLVMRAGMGGGLSN